MSALNGFSSFLTVHSAFAYPILFAGGFFEILVPLGFFLPGEIFFFSAGILAAAGILDVWIADAALVAGGILGDWASFWLGRRYAAPIERFIAGTRFTEGVYLRGKDFVARHRDHAAFLARFFGPASWVVPFLEGTSDMPFPRFALLECVPAALAVSWNVGVGYALGVGYAFADRFAHQSALFAAAAFVIIVIGIPFIFQSRGNATAKPATREP